MDKHVLHNIIHRDSNNSSSDCEVCKGAIGMDDKKALMGKANEILTRKQQMGMSYSEEEKELLAFAEIVNKQTDANKETEDAKTVTADFVTMVKFSEGKEPPKSFKVLPFGTFKTKYGTITLTKNNAQEMVKNFNDGLRAGGSDAGLPIDLEHGETQHKDAAAGWIKKLGIRADGMYCEEADWTSLGTQKLQEGIYKFYSPEFYLNNYVDPETGKVYKNVMTGGGLVNKPAFAHSLNKLVNAENADEKNLTNNETPITIYLEPIKTEEFMDIHKISAKEKTIRSSEEQQFLVDHQDELTFAEAKKEGLVPEAKTTDKTETGRVSMSESEINDLKSQAKAGADAAEKLRKIELSEEVRTLVFTEKGLKLPTAEIKNAVDLLMTMNEDQAKIYKEQLKNLPEKQIFIETGTDEAVDITDPTQAGLKFNEFVNAKRKENKDLSVEDAQKMVAAEHEDLTKIMYGTNN